MKAVYILMAFALSSCGAQKFEQTMKASQFSENDRPYAQEWIGGAPGSGAGITLYFPTEALKNHEFKAVYFRGLSTTNASYTADDRLIMVARMTNGSNERPDLIMDKDPVKESVNKVPDNSTQKIPFELKDDEAVIVVKGNGEKDKFIKLTGIELRPRLNMPAMPQ